MTATSRYRLRKRADGEYVAVKVPTPEQCARATRFIHTEEGWQDWLEHAGNCPICLRDLEQS